MSNINIITRSDKNTVVSEYISETVKSDSFQSEAQLEAELVKILQGQGYEYLTIKSESDLIANLRLQLEKLNNFTFQDDEWKEFFTKCIKGNNEGIIEKTRKIQEDYVQNLTRENGMTKNIKLIDKNNIHNNILQVINQYVEENGNHEARYDVTILVNGLPLVHIELKRRGIDIRQAFNQIKRYQRDSFCASSGLYEYIQIFIISNGTQTKYYANTTRSNHIKEISGTSKSKSKKTSCSFEFTSYWADAKNEIIADLVDFSKTFLSKHTLLNILTRYCVFTADDMLMVMRPYQIAACERILSRIEISTNYKQTGTIKASGYIWHTTGSGKTLTSFKTAQLATKLDYIDKVLFVVDRKDLDYQTMKEYDKFEKGAANSNKSTAILEKQLGNDNCKIIITTIQKLGVFVSKYKNHEVLNKHVVIIFDECHRSQFGELHSQIIKSFKKYHLFGFTGTPIFAENAPSGINKSKNGKILYKTTPQVFGGEPDENGKEVLPLHTYTIVNAINDNNVLPFRIDYINTIKEKHNIKDDKVKNIDREKALASPVRIANNVSYILEHFNQKTKRNDKSYVFNKLMNISEVASAKDKNKVEEIKQKIRMSGFNSILAVSSIPVAKQYYEEFKKQLNTKDLKIAVIFSYSANEEDPDDILLDEESFDIENLDKTSRDFLDYSIKQYNATFGTNYDTSEENFQNYYKDVSLRMKNREIDLLIVVNMFLTGFDATTLNTLWVDKNLKYHGLIQAFSRTNRILNSIKTYGNIVCFRNLEEETNKAIALFGDEKAGSIVLLKTYNEYYYGWEDNGKHYAGYDELINKLTAMFPLGVEITGENAQKEFISLFGSILKLRNILTAFDDFTNDKKISERDLQDYQSLYIDFYQEYIKRNNADKENINDDVVFEIELIKQVEINIDYILMLVAKYHKSNCKDKNILVSIQKAVDSSLELRSKKELIESFIETINVNSNVDEDWRAFVKQQKEADLELLINEEKLKAPETKTFVENSFRDGVLKTTGTDIDEILPPISRFGSNKRKEKKETVIEKLLRFFEKYAGMV